MQLAEPGYQLDNLIGAVRPVVRRQLGWAQTADLVADRLRRHLPAADVLTPAQLAGDPLSYQCHVLHVETDGSFSVVALVWRPGQAAPVHDHVTWCVIGVIQGAEHEERFVLRADGLVRSGQSVSLAGDVCGLAPPGDIHLVRNCGDDIAVSVHIYGTDISKLGTSVRRTYDAPVLER